MSEFKGAGKREGFELWRIENFQAVKQPEVTGKLYEGDSYILLATVMKNNSITWNLHFWLGKDTSLDESGTAAYKTVELDESLGGGPVQYREVQGSESNLFLSYFGKSMNGKPMKGIEYCQGGIASGFKHVEKDVYRTRLLEIKGKKVARVREVEAKTSSLTQGDAFVLDMGLEIFIFVGPTANRQEKMKASEVACHLDDDERGGRAIVYRLEDDPQNATFWGALGGYVDPSALSPGLPDADNDDKFVSKLFRISDGGSSDVAFEEVATGKLARDMLVTGDVFLLHGRETIYLWIGRESSRTEKREAMPSALAYMKRTGIPDTTSVLKVPEGVEPGSFIKEFAVWAPKKEVKMVRTQSGREMTVDAAALASKQIKDRVEEDIAVAEEKLQVWRIENFAAVEEARELYGQFYSGDSYILLYTFKKTKQSKEEYIIYFWQGQNSSTDEKGASALLAKDLDDKMGGSPVQCRVVEGKEPLHFRRLFKGQMIVHQGGVPSGFRQTGESVKEESDSNGVSLYAIHGATPMTTIAKQVASVGKAINSDDCFVLITPMNAFLFKGKRSTSQEKAMAEGVASTLAKGRTISPANEGAEPEAFWTALGGKVAYPEHGEGNEPARDPRLFLASTITGKFEIEEIENFDQSDLNDDDVMLLDTFDEVFVWVGGGATLEEERLSKEFATKYIEAASKTDGRSLSTATVRVQSGSEPFIFTRHFLNWDDKFLEKNKFVDPYEAKVAKLKEAGGRISEAPAVMERKSSLRHVENTDVHIEKVEEPPAAVEEVHVSVEESLVSPMKAMSVSAPSPVAAPKEEEEEQPKPKYGLPVKKISSKESETISAVKSTYDTGKLPPMLAAKVEAKVETIASDTAPITSDEYLPYELLRDTKQPVGVDVSRKEMYLEDAVFQQLFGVDKAKFVTLPKWKRDDQKKKLGLF